MRGRTGLGRPSRCPAGRVGGGRTATRSRRDPRCRRPHTRARVRRCAPAGTRAAPPRRSRDRPDAYARAASPSQDRPFSGCRRSSCGGRAAPGTARSRRRRGSGRLRMRPVAAPGRAEGPRTPSSPARRSRAGRPCGRRSSRAMPEWRPSVDAAAPPCARATPRARPGAMRRARAGPRTRGSGTQGGAGSCCRPDSGACASRTGEVDVRRGFGRRGHESEPLPRERLDPRRCGVARQLRQE